MATYFPSSSQRDATPTIYLPGSYQDVSVLSGHMMYMNSGSYMETLAGNSQQQSHCVELPTTEATDSATEKQEFSTIGGSRIGRNDFGTWRDGRNEMLVMHTQGGDRSSNFNGGQSLQSHGLSLSLGTQIPSGVQAAPFSYRNPSAGVFASIDNNTTIMGDGDCRNGSSRDEQFREAGFLPTDFAAYSHDSNKGDLSHYGMTSIARSIPSSKYLKAAQELLEEVVNVRKALKQPDKEKSQDVNEQGDHRVSSSKNGEDESHDATSDSQSKNNSHSELSHAAKQELQNKLSKLLVMLDEVDRRYKQYYHQMQIIVSSFDVVAGCGAAKPYTAVALQTISCHFRCLRDAINNQIQATRKSLGEQDTSDSSKGVGITRLRYVDQHLRQQRALKQFGMMQHHTWRPQRGLPESSVSILRAWLFEHFLHPYPKDSDKILLARQTGLSRSQVSNWFINARVRLWKPMVEKMYKEEIDDIEMDSNSSSDNTTKTRKGDKMTSKEQSSTSTAAKRCNTGQLMDNKSDHGPDVDMVGSTAKSSFHLAGHIEPTSDCSLHELREEQRPILDDCNIYPDTIMHSEGVADRFMAAAAATCHMSDVDRFGGGYGVSLTLGLQQREAGALPMSNTPHHSFFPMRGEETYSVTPSIDAETNNFGCNNPVNLGNRPSRLSYSHFLHRFDA